MQEEEFLHFGNESYIYNLFEDYQKDKNSIPKEWLRFFQGMELVSESPSRAVATSAGGFDVQRVIDFFKREGHLFAKTGSLLPVKEFDINKHLSHLNISKEDLSSVVSVKEWGISECTLPRVNKTLRKNLLPRTWSRIFQS